MLQSKIFEIFDIFALFPTGFGVRPSDLVHIYFNPIHTVAAKCGRIIALPLHTVAAGCARRRHSHGFGLQHKLRVFNCISNTISLLYMKLPLHCSIANSRLPLDFRVKIAIDYFTFPRGRHCIPCMQSYKKGARSTQKRSWCVVYVVASASIFIVLCVWSVLWLQEVTAVPLMTL